MVYNLDTMKPLILDPKKHLKGATPEKLAKALLKPSHRVQPVVRDKVVSQKIPTDES